MGVHVLGEARTKRGRAARRRRCARRYVVSAKRKQSGGADEGAIPRATKE
jgi:hypothetical protein